MRGRWWGRGLLLLLLALLQACSAVQIGYRQAPNLGYWWLDSQLNLRSEQAEPVREALQQLQRWHREHELPRYAELLAQAQSLSTREVDTGQVCKVWTQVNDGLQRLAVQSVRQLAPLALQLQPQQLRHLARHWDKANADWSKEWLEGSASERLARRQDKAAARYSDFYGSLSDKQMGLLRAQLQASAWNPQWGLQDRLRRQQLLMDALQSLQTPGTTVAQAEAALMAVWQQWLVAPGEADRRVQQTLVQQACQNLAELHNSTSAEQRQRAARRLRAYEQDLRELAGR